MNTFSDYLDPDSDLAHYGVKGMKWGVRKDPQSSSVTPDAAGGGAAETDGRVESGEADADAAIALNKEYYMAGKNLVIANIKDSVIDFGENVANKLFGRKKNKDADYRRERKKNKLRDQMNTAEKRLKKRGLEPSFAKGYTKGYSMSSVGTSSKKDYFVTKGDGDHRYKSSLRKQR